MAISYPINLPSSPAPAEIRIFPRSVVAVSVSPFTGQQQAFQHQGQVWQAEITLPNMLRAKAEPWIAAFLQLNGRYGTFRLGDFSGRGPRGIATGTPQVKGALQTGQSLITDGWTPSQNGILKAGDYIQVGERMHKILIDTNSDSLGNASFDIWPRLRESPADNVPVITRNCTGLFRLTSNEMPWNVGRGMVYSMSFSAVEAI